MLPVPVAGSSKVGRTTPVHPRCAGHRLSAACSGRPRKQTCRPRRCRAEGAEHSCWVLQAPVRHPCSTPKGVMFPVHMAVWARRGSHRERSSSGREDAGPDSIASRSRSGRGGQSGRRGRPCSARVARREGQPSLGPPWRTPASQGAGLNAGVSGGPSRRSGRCEDLFLLDLHVQGRVPLAPVPRAREIGRQRVDDASA